MFTGKNSASGWLVDTQGLIVPIFWTLDWKLVAPGLILILTHTYLVLCALPRGGVDMDYVGVATDGCCGGQCDLQEPEDINFSTKIAVHRPR